MRDWLLRPWDIFDVSIKIRVRLCVSDFLVESRISRCCKVYRLWFAYRENHTSCKSKRIGIDTLWIRLILSFVQQQKRWFYIDPLSKGAFGSSISIPLSLQAIHGIEIHCVSEWNQEIQLPSSVSRDFVLRLADCDYVCMTFPFRSCCWPCCSPYFFLSCIMKLSLKRKGSARKLVPLFSPSQALGSHANLEINIFEWCNETWRSCQISQETMYVSRERNLYRDLVFS